MAREATLEVMVKPIPACKAEPLGQRLIYCSMMLHIWGMLTTDEQRKVNRRIAKAMEATPTPPRTA